MGTLTWGHDALELTFSTDDDAPVSLLSAAARDAHVAGGAPVGLAQVLTVDSGHAPASAGLGLTRLGSLLRYVDHQATSDAGWHRLLVTMEADGLRVDARMESPDGVAAVRSHLTVTAVDRPVVLRSVSSWSGPLGAAGVGAEVFVVDAGWYDDSGHWWDGVGEWRPSHTRFPGGLGEVLDRIRAHGMTPGLWLEPEVVGVRSPVADRLPDSAFLQRGGQRIVEHDRYHLDLRHPAARGHLDEVVDRLVGEFGVGYFKLDYNINPGPGTDVDAPSVGHGLLEHNRAHLAWLDGVADRHPGLILENCGSGAMRADFALLSRLQLQSTSDQQEPRLYPPIAAAAPMQMLPEQAANWAYPQPGMSAEEAAFCLVTGLVGRFYLSGHLNRMTRAELGLVREAVGVARLLRDVLPEAVPSWPLGLPGWTDPVVAVALATERETILAVWRRGGAGDTALPLAGLRGRGCAVEQLFPATLAAWRTRWDREAGVLTVGAGEPGTARLFRLTREA